MKNSVLASKATWAKKEDEVMLSNCASLDGEYKPKI